MRELEGFKCSARPYGDSWRILKCFPGPQGNPVDKRDVREGLEPDTASNPVHVPVHPTIVTPRVFTTQRVHQRKSQYPHQLSSLLSRTSCFPRARPSPENTCPLSGFSLSFPSFPGPPRAQPLSPARGIERFRKLLSGSWRIIPYVFSRNVRCTAIRRASSGDIATPGWTKKRAPMDPSIEQ